MITFDLAARLAAVEQEICRQAAAAGRPRSDIKLIAVSKKQPVEAILAAYALGVRDFGENLAQELQKKAEALRDFKDIRWHFLGRLQSNKLKILLPLVSYIHSLDSLEIARKLEARLQEEGRCLKVLLQINIGAEPQKGGVLPNAALSLAAAVQQECPHLELRGFMAIPPVEQPALTYFRQLQQQLQEFNQWQATALPAARPLAELSMGMSQDFPEAIASGATMLRIGTLLFGER